MKNIISDPTNPLAAADLRLIEPLLDLLGMLAQNALSQKLKESERICGMYHSCVMLFEEASLAVQMVAAAAGLGAFEWPMVGEEFQM